MTRHLGSVFHQLYHPNITNSIVTNSAIKFYQFCQSQTLSSKYDDFYHLNITNSVGCVDVKLVTIIFIDNTKSIRIVSRGMVCWVFYSDPYGGVSGEILKP